MVYSHWQFFFKSTIVYGKYSAPSRSAHQTFISAFLPGSSNTVEKLYAYILKPAALPGPLGLNEGLKKTF